MRPHEVNDESAYLFRRFCLEEDRDGFISGAELHALYRRWHTRYREGKPMSRRALLRHLGGYFALVRRQQHGIRDRGLAVRVKTESAAR